MRRALWAIGLSVVVLTIPAGVASAATPIQYVKPVAYTLVAPTSESASGLISRVVLPAGNSCPSLSVIDNGSVQSLPMSVRPTPKNTGTAYSNVVVCEIAVPSGVDAKGVIIAESNIDFLVPTALSQPVTSIAVLGDSGCRIGGGSHVQNCANTNAWPLASISNAIAAKNPDLIIHLGDYLYVKDACKSDYVDECGAYPPPPSNAPFSGSANLFFEGAFTPMASMLDVAPILAMRGNHEACSGDGNAYFYFMDPHFGTSSSCSPASTGKHAKTPKSFMPTWYADISTSAGNLRLSVVDSTYGWDTDVSKYAKKMHPGFVAAQDLAKSAPAGSTNWLLTHRPIFGVAPKQQAEQYGKNNNAWVSRDTTAASDGTLSGFNTILSGHMHLAQAVQIPNQPGQLIVGNGGTTLDPKSGYKKPQYGPLAAKGGKAEYSGYAPYKNLSQWWTNVNFGYALVLPNPGSWNVAMNGVSSQIGSCTLSGANIACS